MTREEAIEALTSKDVCNSDIMLEALEMAIEALKQKDILDKIRAEIERTAKDYDKIDDYRDGRGFWLSLGIIDKHIGKD